MLYNHFTYEEKTGSNGNLVLKTDAENSMDGASKQERRLKENVKK